MIKMRFRLSQSSLNLMKESPRCFLLTNRVETTLKEEIKLLNEDCLNKYYKGCKRR